MAGKLPRPESPHRVEGVCHPNIESSVPCRKTAVAWEESLSQISRSVFRDVFASAEALAVPVRLQLSALLAAPGHPRAILPRQLASSRLPVDLQARAEIRRTVEAGITAQTIETLAPHRLAAIVPARFAAIPKSRLDPHHHSCGCSSGSMRPNRRRWPGSRSARSMDGRASGRDG